MRPCAFSLPPCAQVWRIRGRLFVLVILVASFSPSRAAETPTLAPLRVGTSGDYAPFSTVDAGGRRSGFDIEVAERLATDLGRRVEFVAFRWPDLAGELQRGSFDIAMSGVTQRPERALAATLTRPYATTGTVAVVRSADRGRYPTLAALNQPHVRLAVNRGGHLEREAHRLFPAAQLVTAADNRALPGLLERADADAVISEQFEAQTWDPAAFATIGPFTRDAKVYAVPHAATDLAERVNDWLAAREADGWLNQVRRRWLGAHAQVTPAQASFDAVAAAIDLRMGLMPLMGAVKRREHLPLIDPAQRQRVLEQVRAAATRAGLQPQGVADFFRVQIELAEDIQARSTPPVAPADTSLADVRAAIAGASASLIVELGRSQPWLQGQAQRERLSATVRASLTASGTARADVDRVIAALRRIAPAAPPAAQTPAEAPGSAGHAKASKGIASER